MSLQVRCVCCKRKMREDMTGWQGRCFKCELEERLQQPLTLLDPDRGRVEQFIESVDEQASYAKAWAEVCKILADEDSDDEHNTLDKIRYLSVIYGDPNKPKPQGVVDARNEPSRTS